MVSLLFQNGNTKYHVLVSQKSTRFYRLYLVGIDSMCFINSILSTLSGRDRLDVFYQLDFIQVRIDSMCFYQLDFIQVRIDLMCFYQLDFIQVRIDSMCFYQLDFIQVRIDSMCFINSILRGSTRFQAAGGKGEFRGQLDIEAILLQQRR